MSTGGTPAGRSGDSNSSQPLVLVASQMPKRVSFSSDDRQAIATWTRGVLSDSVQLCVRGSVVDRQKYYGMTWPDSKVIMLQGGGYRAAIEIGWPNTFVSEATHGLVEPLQTTDANRNHRSNSNHAPSQEASGPSELEYRQWLDLENSEITLDDVKSAYRQIARKYHPDVLHSKNLPEDMIEYAQNRMIKAQSALRYFQERFREQ